MTLPRLLPKSKRLGMPERIRSPGHLKWVRQHGCSVKGCKDTDIHAHHVRLGSHAGMGQKPCDSKVVSLCQHHHDRAHDGEATFQVDFNLDLHALAQEFADKSPVLRRRKRG